MTFVNKYKYKRKLFPSNSIYWYLLLSLIAIQFQSCKSSYILQDGESKLFKNEIDIDSDYKVTDKLALIESLKLLYLQNESSRTTLNPKTWNTGNEVVAYDEELAQQTANVMEKYLQNKKGYYHASVKYQDESNKKGIIVKYLVNPGPQYVINEIKTEVSDNEIGKLLAILSPFSFLKEGEPLDAITFDKEKTRITAALQNAGYAKFLINYIEIEGDSSVGDYKVDVFINISDPPYSESHKKYSVDTINIFTNHVADNQQEIVTTDSIGQNYYHSTLDRFIIKPKALQKSLFLQPGNVYQKNNLQKTFANLSNLSTYRYVNIQSSTEDQQDTTINLNIFLTPHNHPWILDFGSDFFYSTVSEIGRNLFGLSGSTTLQNRNLLGGSELYTLDLEGTLEFDLGEVDANSISYRIQNGLRLPRHIDLFSLTNVLKTFKIIKDDRVRSFKERSTTNIQFGYSYTKIINLYRLNSVNLSWGYDYRPSNRSQYLIRQLSLNLLDTQVDSVFQEEILDNNQFLENSFVDNLSTGFLFRDISYVYQSLKARGRSYSLIGSIEFSGAETYLLNKLSNVVRGRDDVWSLGSINFAKYVKTEGQARVYKDLTTNSSLAGRIHLGLAVPYGGRDVAVPYIVQFFSGGPNSIRAWQLRELGPGSRVIDPSDNSIYFQTGDLKFEFNVEYRARIFWFIEGALFVEGGNIWTLREDGDRPGSKISSGFLNEMGVGAGFGLRFDFTYFLIRLDTGYKIRNPFRDPETGSYWALTRKYNSPLGNINIAVGYPF